MLQHYRCVPKGEKTNYEENVQEHVLVYLKSPRRRRENKMLRKRSGTYVSVNRLAGGASKTD